MIVYEHILSTIPEIRLESQSHKYTNTTSNNMTKKFIFNHTIRTLYKWIHITIRLKTTRINKHIRGYIRSHKPHHYNVTNTSPDA